MKTTTDLSMLKQAPLFESLPEAEIALLQDDIQVLQQPKNTFLYDLDDASEHLYVLCRGSVKIGTFSSDGREVLKHIAHPLTLLGELALAGETHRRDFARILNEDALLLAIPVARIKAFMQESPDFAMRVLQHIGSRLLQTERRMESLIFQDARTRIIQFLKESASKRGRRVGFEWLLKHSLTQQDIANITGTSRQTVTSVLNELRKENLIHFNRRSILIRDLTRLA